MTDLPSADIVVTKEGRGEVDGVYVYNNVVHNVTGEGYRVGDHPGGKASGGTIRSVHFINNTAYDTGTEIGGGFRVNHAKAQGIVFRNNIAWGNRSYDIRGESETLIEWSLCAEEICPVRTNPGVVDAAAGDFRLRDDSLALDRGSAEGAPVTDLLGVRRAQGQGIDPGADELPVADTPLPRSQTDRVCE